MYERSTCVKKDQETVLHHLIQAWNYFARNNHDLDDLNDFRKCIHDAQRIIITEIHTGGGQLDLSSSAAIVNVPKEYVK